MPFIGMLLGKNEARKMKPCAETSYLTQKLLLVALYEEWDGITVTEAAKKMEVSKMSITRVFDELECMGLPVLVKGLNKFHDYFVEYAQQYVLIGGAARDISFQDIEIV